MPTPAVSHIILTVSDLDRARQFYGDLLGFQIKDLPDNIPGLFAGTFYFVIGGLDVFFLKHDQTAAGDRFSEFRIGLDHLAFTAPDEEFMEAMAEKLKKAGVETKGVQIFPLTGNKYMAFRDPDNIQLEYWLNKPGE
jgi:catechol 2,3-dioxygenase-like lactoylglutathione lyase family enzyme